MAKMWKEMLGGSVCAMGVCWKTDALRHAGRKDRLSSAHPYNAQGRTSRAKRKRKKYGDR